MRRVEAQARAATATAIRRAAQSILAFLQCHPDDLDALNNAMMPFAYLTLLNPPPRRAPGTGECADGDSVSPLQLDPPSTTGLGCGNLSAESAESDLEVVSPKGPRADARPAQLHEALPPDERPPSQSAWSRRGNSQLRHGNRPGEFLDNATSQAECRRPGSEFTLNPAVSASGGLLIRDHGDENQNHRPAQGERERAPKRAKHQKQRSNVRQSFTRQTGDIGSSSPTSRPTEETASTVSPAPERLATGACVKHREGDYNQLVSAWINDPEILRFAQAPALARQRQPRQELSSYLDLIASIGTEDVARSFAVGVAQLMCHARFSYEVPSAPDHLLYIEDADAMQCFWRAAYRSQVNASLVSFGVILHRRSLATLRYCYFKAISSIKLTMQRKGLPGHTKSAIARGILLDTVFPGSDRSELKRMSDRLKNDVTRARNYCRLIEYYGSSGILGLLPRSLTDTRMRDFTDAEFDIFLSLVARLRPDLEAERTTPSAVESGTFSRMRIWGRVIDMTQAGLRPLKDDYDFVQKDTGILLLPQVDSTLEVAPLSRANAVAGSMKDQTLGRSSERDAGQIIVSTAASTVSQRMGQVNFDTCGPPVVPDSDLRVHEVSK